MSNCQICGDSEPYPFQCSHRSAMTPTPEPQVDVPKIERLMNKPALEWTFADADDACVQVRALLNDRARHTAALKELEALLQELAQAMSWDCDENWHADLKDRVEAALTASAIVDGLEK